MYIIIIIISAASRTEGRSGDNTHSGEVSGKCGVVGNLEIKDCICADHNALSVSPIAEEVAFRGFRSHFHFAAIVVCACTSHCTSVSIRCHGSGNLIAVNYPFCIQVPVTGSHIRNNGPRIAIEVSVGKPAAKTIALTCNVVSSWQI